MPSCQLPPASLTGPAARRPWTRWATVGAGAHVFYELLAGVGMPFTARLGPGGGTAFWAGSAATAYVQAARQRESRDALFAGLDGLYLSAVIAHFAGWPCTRKAGLLPWLTECEGLSGPVLAPYNAILHASGLTALVALLTENRGARKWGAVVPVVVVPWLLVEQRREFGRRVTRATQDPAWWNRRLRR